ncbi:MAG TPA: sigma-70 family RNA polymerase sigma factor [Chitinophagales bacterium]|nr:sigma-70 family RNA polymerase sigma factor [Chitinophagales bacterium]HMU97681.1 sigma-70 family RNA polymerase sigma factor [Chitinophagales bacterium]HMV02529.1 sigma-70 family RNA polymerase sigma factor [Chitinophagales bacterium]HMW94612.1 sigma-70 family RNA polymerase sigma factor [Chitinophagales bacterium]HMY42452.1 sigma-70 family RNA polymerase sigma factor [Chitinophagales bacterium]
MKHLKITSKITTRDSYSIDRYLSEISKLPLLSDNEEIELAQMVKKGSTEAVNKIITANLRFVVSVAKQYQNQGMSLNDLINEGNIGLIKAASKFDETKGFKFISYAVWWIRQSILQALIEQPRIVRLPMNKAIVYNRIMNVIQDFEQKNQREPSNDELAELLDMRADELIILRRSLAFHSSVDVTIGEDDDTTVLDTMVGDTFEQPDNNLIRNSLDTEIKHSFQILSDREQEVIKYYFGMNEYGQTYSLDEIGEKMDLTRERVRQIKDKAIRKMRKNKCALELKTFLQ